MYPPLNDNNNGGSVVVGVTELRMSSLSEVQEQQLPLNGDETLTGVGGVSGGGGGAMPGNRRRKVKFLQKLMNFCGDPKRREQTCSKRNRTFTLCKEIGRRRRRR